MSPNETKLQAESRTEFGKGAARRIRREHKVPAVLYGHGSDPLHITLPGHDTLMALKHGGANALLSIELDGKSQLALPKQVQRDAIKGFLEHLDLIIVKKGEKVTVDVPIVVTGDSAAETLVNTEHNTVALEVEATHIPESIEVSVEGAEAGTQIHAKDLKLPSGAALAIDEEALIVNVTVAKEIVLEEEAPEGEAAEGAAAEGEATADEAAADEAPAEDAASE
ncbi:MAG TPA: 50S ribosomal protein L25/general stress protein Ctc [Nocardioidaceae bacterium]|nr:50S ribosomal protein L25/general stress protein Ctc [Nocardioidaceae bacterium]